MADGRYAQILDLIRETKPRTIIEIGVARIVRAREMAVEAGWHHPNVHYIGFDVFESVGAYETEEAQRFHAAAFNAKRVESVSWCASKLNWIRKDFPHMAGFTFELVRGDTRSTLHSRPRAADFVFIDGDHRLEAIRGDYRALKLSRVVVLDDYFEPDDRGCPDTSAVGCNGVIDEIAADPEVEWKILPVADRGKDCGVSKLVVVRRKAG